MADFNMDVFGGSALENLISPYDNFLQEEIPGDTHKEEKVDTIPKEEDKVIIEEEIQTPPSDSKSSKNIDNKSPLLPFAKLLEERGYFKLAEDKEINSFDDIDDLLNQTIRERELAQLTPRQKQVLEWIEGGVPEDAIIQHETFQQSVTNITDEDLEDEEESGIELRKGILTKYYELKGFDQAKIDKNIKRLVASGDEIDEAKDALKEIKAIEEANFQKQQEKFISDKKAEEEAAKENLKKLQTFINTTKEIIPGLNIQKKVKDELYDKLTKPVSTKKYIGADGKEFTRPLDIVEDFLANATIEDKAILGYYIMVTDKFKKHDMFSTKKAKSATEKQLEESIRSTDFKEFQRTGIDDLAFLDNVEFGE